MKNELVLSFAKVLIDEVRDRSVLSHLNALRANHVVSKRWQQSSAIGSPDELLRVAVPDIVDGTIFYLLNAIDSRVLPLSYSLVDGNPIDLCQVGQGEMGGWYMGSGGWRAEFSKMPYFDDFSQLK